ncbi:hypothetical protein [Nocardia lijiangensis]|uniref:hypothetical protein n=1 Tax=Nocardia lijiangensis TaxID=299618 RepID=UPI003D759DB8
MENDNTASATLMARSGFHPAAIVTLFVRPNPEEPEADADAPLPPIAPGTERDLIRRGRLAGRAAADAEPPAPPANRPECPHFSWLDH